MSENVAPAGKVKFAFFKRLRANFERVLYEAQVPRNGLLPQILFGAAMYAVIYNSVVYYIKGPEHPINNFRYHQWESEGKLPADVKEKADIISNATQKNVDSIREHVFFWQTQADDAFDERRPPYPKF
ncbi:unnamed protein product [Bursaphelenchus okinawaensis]|uniref:Uncharacterized protein n=1 Tax=Bursaphelenchus okinawaensis TaxID=465554 RepID=A0A811LQU5_9BILA|nr:unnamed protein product [Bursaphelenchus okinawaensis]CAG9127430.1 unnamed protein product [Bursaphelenchus okinawaensis]